MQLEQVNNKDELEYFINTVPKYPFKECSFAVNERMNDSITLIVSEKQFKLFIKCYSQFDQTNICISNFL